MQRRIISTDELFFVLCRLLLKKKRAGENQDRALAVAGGSVWDGTLCAILPDVNLSLFFNLVYFPLGCVSDL